MRIIVDIEDFWIDDEGDLQTELEQHVTSKVLSEIWKSVEKKVADQITRQVKETVDNVMYKKASIAIEKAFEVDEVIDMKVNEGGKYVTKKVSITKYLNHKFKTDSGWQNPNKIIEKLAISFGDDLKKRYDLLFASQIVSKLGDNGLLKDDVVKMLLDSNK